jgi:osmotically-inducible protein OsmY
MKQAVLDELNWDPSINSSHIGVTARDGVVTMSGHVGSYAERYAAEKAAERVSGVRAVAEELEVHYPANMETGDDDIAKRAIQSITWDVMVPNDKVKIEVTKGFVTLRGDLDYKYQKEAVESGIRRLSGVTGICNEITIKPKATPAGLKAKIKAALVRNAQIDAEEIDVTTDGGTVILRGGVDTCYERVVAERVAWSAPGVTHVEDLLTVN